MNAINVKGYLLTVTELRTAITGLEQKKADRPQWIQRLLLSALAEVHASGNHSAFTRLATAASLPKAERGAVIAWCESNTWLTAIADSKGKFQGFKKEKGKALPTVEAVAATNWYAPILEAKAAKEAAKKADAERGALIASLPTETAPTETAPTGTAITGLVDEAIRINSETVETVEATAELAAEVVAALSDEDFADFAIFFSQEKERREQAMITAIRKAA